MRTLSDALLAKQIASYLTPATKLLFNRGVNNTKGEATYNYTAKLLALEHREEPYQETATILLQNNDHSIADDLTGYWIEIPYGAVTGNAVAEPDGDGRTKEWAYTPRLWVRHQSPVSAPGVVQEILELAGAWVMFNDLQYVPDESNPIQAPLEPSDPGYPGPYLYPRTKTIYQILGEMVSYINTKTGLTFALDALGTQDDGIINTFLPWFPIVSLPPETVASIIQRLMAMTLCYLRMKAGLHIEVRFPQDSDSVDETYYSDQMPQFVEYRESVNLLLPNRVIVIGSSDGETYDPAILGVEEDTDQINKYMLVPRVYPDITLNLDADAEKRALAIITRLQAEVMSGRFYCRHDARIELYDREKLYDTRGLT